MKLSTFSTYWAFERIGHLSHYFGCNNFYIKKLLEIIFFFYYRWLENHQVDAGLLSENEYTIQRRKDVCAQMIKLEKQGYYVVYLDES